MNLEQPVFEGKVARKKKRSNKKTTSRKRDKTQDKDDVLICKYFVENSKAKGDPKVYKKFIKTGCLQSIRFFYPKEMRPPVVFRNDSVTSPLGQLCFSPANKEHRLAAYGLLKDAKLGWVDYEKGGEGLEGFHTTLLHNNKKPWVVANIDKWWGLVVSLLVSIRLTLTQSLARLTQ